MLVGLLLASTIFFGVAAGDADEKKIEQLEKAIAAAETKKERDKLFTQLNALLESKKPNKKPNAVPNPNQIDKLRAQTETYTILPQPETTPLKIVVYRGGGANDIFFQKLTDVKNTSGKSVVAYQLGFSYFDAFNELILVSFSYSNKTIDIQNTHRTTGALRNFPAAKFVGHGTSIAWVDKVRFSDGTVWHYDRGLVLEELKKIQKDLTLEGLKEKITD